MILNMQKINCYNLLYFQANNILLIKIDKKIPKKELDSLIEACNAKS
jgi:hypothetical protein